MPNPNIPQGAVNTPQQPAANSGNGAPKNFGWTF
jgi:hypothetical protein